MGISEEEFWEMSPKRVYIRQKAYEIEMENKRDFMLNEAWVNGFYVREALMSTVGNFFNKKKPYEYPKNPTIKEEPKEMTLEEKEKQFDAFFLQFEQFKKKK